MGGYGGELLVSEASFWSLVWRRAPDLGGELQVSETSSQFGNELLDSEPKVLAAREAPGLKATSSHGGSES